MIPPGRTRRLEHRPLWGEVPPQDGEPTRCAYGSSAVVHDILPRREGDSLEPGFHLLAGDSSAFAVQKSCVEQKFQDDGEATHSFDVGHDVLPRGF